MERKYPCTNPARRAHFGLSSAYDKCRQLGIVLKYTDILAILMTGFRIERFNTHKFITLNRLQITLFGLLFSSLSKTGILSQGSVLHALLNSFFVLKGFIEGEIMILILVPRLSVR